MPVSLLILLSLTSYGSQEDVYRKWIKTEVAYIASDREVREFRSLTDDEAQRAFIRRFWQRRDPDPSTAVNEFQQEHERRLRYVAENFDREGKPGWKTTRGRAYIIHGPPDNVSYSFGGQQRVSVRNPTDLLIQSGTAQALATVEITSPVSESWIYRSLATVNGYRPRFTIIFAKMEPMELFQLQKVIAQVGASNDLSLRYYRDNLIKRFITNREYLRNDYRVVYAGAPNFLMLSDFLLAIFDPLRGSQISQFDIMEATADLDRSSGERLEMLDKRRRKMEEMVSGRVFYGQLPVQVGTAFLKGQGQQVLLPIHVRVQPHAEPPTREVDILAELVEIPGNNTVAMVQDRILTLNPDTAGMVSYQSRLGAPPGRYRLRVVASDIENKRIGIWEEDLELPSLAAEGLNASPLMICEKVLEVADYHRQAESLARRSWLHHSRQHPVRFDDWVFVPSADRSFRRLDNLTTLLEVYNPKLTAGKPTVQVQAICRRRGEAVAATDVKELEHLTGEGGDVIVYAFSVSLRGLDPGDYDMIVRVVDTHDGNTLTRQAPFTIH